MESDLDQDLRKRTQLTVHFLSDLLTNHSFDEKTLATFESELRKALSLIVTVCTVAQSENGVHRIAFVCLEESLKCLDWKLILEQRAVRLKQDTQSGAKRTLSTPFDLLLSCWKDPTLWPPACNGPLVKVVLEQLLFHRSGTNRVKRSVRCGRRDWSPSYNLLLNFFIATIQQQPSLHATKIIAWIRTNLKSDETDPETLNVSISIVKELIRSFPSRGIVLVPFFLDLLCNIETMIHKSRSTLSRAPESETGQPRRTRSGLAHGSNIAVLHGESSDHEEEAYYNRFFLQLANKHTNQQATRVNRKKIFHANTQSVTSNVVHDQIKFLCALRLKCLKAFLSFSKDYSKTFDEGAIEQSSFHAILELVRSRPGSETSYIRLAALILIDASSQSDMLCPKLLEMLWSRVDKTKDPCTYLSFYVELLIEASIFDEKDALAEAIQPLCDRAKRLILISEHRKPSVSSQGTLHCIAFLLVYRGTMLLQVPGFKFLLAQLSVEFTSPRQWLLSSSISSYEELKLLTSLRASGIFGIEDDEDEDDEIEQTSETSWFYDPHRGSTIRVCNFFSSLASPDLFSRWSPTNSNPKPSAGAKINQSLRSHAQEGTVLHDLGDDMLREVFSFLGFKRIVFNRQVCKRWKCIGDDEYNTWMPLYLGRFGVDPEDPKLVTALSLPWKQLFMERWVAEKEIRFKRDRNGWRWRLCRRIGCLTVQSSPSRLLKHKSTHEVTSKKRKRTRQDDATPTQNNYMTAKVTQMQLKG